MENYHFFVTLLNFYFYCSFLCCFWNSSEQHFFGTKSYIKIKTISIVLLFFQYSMIWLFSGFASPKRTIQNPEPDTLPTFGSQGKRFRVVTNDTVVLPCDVINPGKYNFQTYKKKLFFIFVYKYKYVCMFVCMCMCRCMYLCVWV